LSFREIDRPEALGGTTLTCAATKWMRWTAAAAVACACGVSQGQNLNQKLQGVIAGAKLGSAKVAVSVRDLDSGSDIVDIGADTPMKPASNMKLLTSGTALVVLGPDFAFRTELVVDGAPGMERLVIRGSGDPALADPAVLERMNERLSVDALLERLAGAVKAAGVSRLSEVIVDDRVFDREWIHPTWPKDQLEKWYCAPICGVNFHANVLSVFPAPTNPGRPPTIQLEPSLPWLDIENKAQTVSTGKKATGSRSSAMSDSRHASRSRSRSAMCRR
jgi:serine-type D-Ala-D-Ala carboxypeptidase/endopeptidase (penicillin-binding protein 4)